MQIKHTHSIKNTERLLCGLEMSRNLFFLVKLVDCEKNHIVIVLELFVMCIKMHDVCVSCCIFPHFNALKEVEKNNCIA